MRAAKTVVIVACLVMTSSWAVQAQDGLHGIPWARDLRSAQETAAREKRLVLLHFWTPDCAPCETVERYVFSHPEVARAIAANYVPVSVNAQALPDLAKRFGVDRWPTDVIISPEGEVLTRTVSPKDANQYMSLVNRVAATRKPTSLAGSQLAPSSRQQPAATQVGGFQTNAPTANLYAGAAQGSTESRGAVRNPYLSGKGATSYAGNPYVDVTAPPADAETSAGQFQGGYAQFQGGQHNPAAAPTRGGSFAGPANAGSESAAGAAPRGGSFGEPVVNPGSINPGAVPNGFAAQRWQENSQVASPRGENILPRGADFRQVTSESTLERQDAATPKPTGSEKPIALSGYCPVSLVESQGWKRGNAEFGAVHRGRTYLFAGQREQAAFLADPDRFSPVLSGFDPVKFCERGEFVEGKRQHGVFFHDQIFLFADEASLDRFWKSPDAFAKIAHEAMLQNALGNRQR